MGMLTLTPLMWWYETAIYHTWDGNVDSYTTDVVVCLNNYLRKCLLWKERLNIDEEEMNMNKTNIYLLPQIIEHNKQGVQQDGKSGITLIHLVLFIIYLRNNCIVFEELLASIGHLMVANAILLGEP